MFKDCITTVRSCHACKIFDRKTRIPPAPLQPVVIVGPFAKWGIDFMTCNATLAWGHGYIIVAVDYFTKWAEAMPTLNNNGETASLCFFNHVVSRFDVPQAIVTDHGSHFLNHMMVELAAKLGLSHDNSTPYYPQANGQVEAINKVLKRILQRMIGVHKRSWHLILYSALWAYQTLVRNVTEFTPFQLVYGLEAILPIQCEISSLKLAVDLLPETLEEEARFLELIQLDETRHDATLANESHKKRVKESDKLGAGKFKSLWMGPYIVKRVLAKGAYELVDYDGIPLAQPHNSDPLLHLLQMSDLLESFVGYADGASLSSRNLSSAAWAFFDPSGELVSFRGVCIGRSTNNIAE
eukprot:PITA_32089